MSRALLVALALVAPLALRAQPAVGDAMPEGDRLLPAVAGAERTLASLRGTDGLVVVFWSNTCPWGDRLANRVSALADDYAAQGVEVVLVNSNAPKRLEAESTEAGREELATFARPLPYLLDGDGVVAAAFGVRSAPHVFYFGADGRLVYHGAFDDSPSSADRVEQPWLRTALDQALAGLPVTVAPTLPFGCRLEPADVQPVPTAPPPTP